MSEDDKQKQLQRHRKALQHLKTREQERQLKDARKARAHEQRRRRDAGDDDAEFEKMRRRERVLARGNTAAATTAATPPSGTTRATIVGLAPGRARVLDEQGERGAVLAPQLASAQQTEVAVGDQVWLCERDGAEPLVAAVLPRRSELARADPHDPHRRRVLAANVDLVVLVLDATRLRTGLIDRLALLLQDSGAALAVCVNKCDLPHDEAARELVLLPHRQAGRPIAVVSAARGDGVSALRALLAGRSCAFVGHSGVGKSTLLNRLDPARSRATGAVRERDGRGRHTTSSSTLSVLADGTMLIDTPGVRALGLDDGERDLDAAFPDIAALSRDCRFRDCSHSHEPGCAVRAAVDQGALPAARHAAFLRLLQGDR